MNNLLNVQKFSTTNTKQTFNKNECKLKETKYSWFTSLIVRVANKIAQVFGVKTITQHNLSNSLCHATVYLVTNNIDIEISHEVKSTINEIKKTFSNYLNSDKGSKDLIKLANLEISLNSIINIKTNQVEIEYNFDLIPDNHFDRDNYFSHNKHFNQDDYLSDDMMLACYLSNDEPLFDRNEPDLNKQKQSNNFTYFLEGNSEDEIRIKTKIYK